MAELVSAKTSGINDYDECAKCGGRDYGVRVGDRWVCWACIEKWARTTWPPEVFSADYKVRWKTIPHCCLCNASNKKASIFFIKRFVCRPCLEGMIDERSDTVC